jgi:hypothetical protein
MHTAAALALKKGETRCERAGKDCRTRRSLLNALGLPGFVSEADFGSENHGTRVRIRCGDQFTVISVNGVDVYFRRLSGRIDGVGSSSNPT